MFLLMNAPEPSTTTHENIAQTVFMVAPLAILQLKCAIYNREYPLAAELLDIG